MGMGIRAMDARATTTKTRGERSPHGVFSAVRLRRMHDILRRDADAGRLPGLVAAVDRRGETHIDPIGTLALGSRAPMRHDTIFRLASMTKPITAVAAMTLIEDCTLRLDDAVDEWLPELANRKVLRRIDGPLDDTVPAKRPITVRDLFTFRAGYGEMMFVAPGSPLHTAMVEARLPLAEWIFPGTADELMKRLGALPLAHQPGERWLYHMGAEILGVLVGRASGKPLGQILRERIFEPLGMKDTGFRVPEAEIDRFTTCYRSDPSTGAIVVHDEARGGLLARPQAFESGAGGLVSTADDMLAFGRMMLNGGAYGGERVLSRASVELMTTDQLTQEEKAISPFFVDLWATNGWGLGLSVVTRRRDVARRRGSFGWDGAFGTSWWVDPSEDLVGVLMTQRVPDTLALPAVVTDFWTATYQAIEG